MARGPVQESTAPPVTPEPPYPKRGSRKEKAAPEKEYEDTTDPKTRRNARPPVDDLYKQWEKKNAEAMKRRNPWISIWQQIYDYVLPQRESFFDTGAGEQQTDMIYDETAVVGVPRLASRLVSGFFPEAGELFGLEFGEEAPAHLQGFDGEMKLRQLTEMIHRAWHNSNLPVEIGEGMIDFAIGTMNMAQEPGDWPGTVVFKTVPATNIAIIPGPGGTVAGWFQWRKNQPIEAIYQEFGRRGTWPDAFMRDLKRDPRREVTLNTATWDASTLDETKYQQLAVLTDYKAVIYDHVVKGEGSCPWTTTRWARTGVDVWGRGAVMNVMPAVKTCNLTVQLVLENAELALGGVWTYDDDGVFNPDNVVLAPGTFIPKSREGKIEPLQSAAQFNVADIVLADQRQNIKKGLFIDEMDAPGKTPRSAFEIQSRLAEVARDLAAPGARLVHECLTQQVNRTIYIFEQQGVLDALKMRVDGRRIRLTVRSPLLRGQDQVELNELMQWGGQVDALFGAGTASMILDRKTTIPYISKRNGIPLTLVRSDEAIKADMARAQAGALALQAGSAQATGGAGGDVAQNVMDAAAAGSQ